MAMRIDLTDRVAIVTGAAKGALVHAVRDRLASSEPFPDAEYPVYPPSLWSPYRERRFDNGEQLYAALGIPHHAGDHRCPSGEVAGDHGGGFEGGGDS